MIVSEMTVNDVVDYIRLEETTENDLAFLGQALDAAKSYIQKYTGLDADAVDQVSEFVMVVYVLCQDAYDNRSLYISSANVNQMVTGILDMHSVNLLPQS